MFLNVCIQIWQLNNFPVTSFEVLIKQYLNILRVQSSCHISMHFKMRITKNYPTLGSYTSQLAWLNFSLKLIHLLLNLQRAFLQYTGWEQSKLPGVLRKKKIQTKPKPTKILWVQGEDMTRTQETETPNPKIVETWLKSWKPDEYIAVLRLVWGILYGVQNQAIVKYTLSSNLHVFPQGKKNRKKATSLVTISSISWEYWIQ